MGEVTALRVSWKCLAFYELIMSRYTWNNMCTIGRNCLCAYSRFFSYFTTRDKITTNNLSCTHKMFDTPAHTLLCIIIKSVTCWTEVLSNSGDGEYVHKLIIIPKFNISMVSCATGPYLPCVSMAGKALLAGYHRYVWCKRMPGGVLLRGSFHG